MTEKIELGLDHLDVQKVEKLEERFGEERIQTILEQNLTQIVRELYDSRERLRVQEEAEEE